MEVVSTLFTDFMGFIGTVASTISTSALLLIPVGITVTSAAIGMAKGLIGTRRGRRR